jgi:hypothetical protein
VHPRPELGKRHATEAGTDRDHRQQEQEAAAGLGDEQAHRGPAPEVAGCREDQLGGEEGVGLEGFPLQLGPLAQEPPVTAGLERGNESEPDQLYPQARR